MIRSLETVNFRNLPDGGRFEFGEGLTIVYGLNEAGKSSMLEAVAEGLFGKTARRDPPFARWGCRNMPIVRIGLVDDEGREFRLVRNYQERRSYLDGPGVQLQNEASIEGRIREWWGLKDSDLFRHLLVVSQGQLEFKDGKSLGTQVEALAAGTPAGKPVAAIVKDIEGKIGQRAERPFKGRDGAKYDGIASELEKTRAEIERVSARLREVSEHRSQLYEALQKREEERRRFDEIERVLEWAEVYVPHREADRVLRESSGLNAELRFLGGRVLELEGQEKGLARLADSLRKVEDLRTRLEAAKKSVESDKGLLERVERIRADIAQTEREIDGPEILEEDKRALDLAFSEIESLENTMNLQSLELAVRAVSPFTLRMGADRRDVKERAEVSLRGYRNEVSIEGVADMTLTNRGLAAIQEKLERCRAGLESLERRLAFSDRDSLHRRYEACKRKRDLLRDLRAVLGDRDQESLRDSVARGEREAARLQGQLDDALAAAASAAADVGPEARGLDTAERAEGALAANRSKLNSIKGELRKKEGYREALLGKRGLDYWMEREAELRVRLAGIAVPESEIVREMRSAPDGSDEPERLLRGLREEKERMQRAIADLGAKIEGIQGRLHNAPTYEDLVSMKEEENRLAELKSRAEEHHEVLTIVRDTLLQAYGRVKAGLTSAIEREAGKVFTTVTRGRYSAVKLDIGNEIGLSVVDDSGRVREVNEQALKKREFSEGTLQQLYLSVRLGVSRALLGGRSLPLFLDDALADFDDERFRAAMEVLGELARSGQQVVLFTCHRRHAACSVDYVEVAV
ncbi:MAG: AAA family ATPase [Firmicutes bacterium]|jgi:DNA repair exonuclease SbcCD ATPase subunit|nr:AAA family ATPase [Bacillota bacterium]